jgi:hypothetical protein
MMDFTYIMITIALVGTLFNNKISLKYKSIGFFLWIISNSMFAIWSFAIMQYNVFALYVIYILLSIQGFFTHYKKYINKHRNP